MNYLSFFVFLSSYFFKVSTLLFSVLIAIFRWFYHSRLLDILLTYITIKLTLKYNGYHVAFRINRYSKANIRGNEPLDKKMEVVHAINIGPGFTKIRFVGITRRYSRIRWCIISFLTKLLRRAFIQCALAKHQKLANIYEELRPKKYPVDSPTEVLEKAFATEDIDEFKDLSASDSDSNDVSHEYNYQQLVDILSYMILDNPKLIKKVKKHKPISYTYLFQTLDGKYEKYFIQLLYFKDASDGRYEKIYDKVVKSASN